MFGDRWSQVSLRRALPRRRRYCSRRQRRVVVHGRHLQLQLVFESGTLVILESINQSLPCPVQHTLSTRHSAYGAELFLLPRTGMRIVDVDERLRGQVQGSYDLPEFCQPQVWKCADL